MVAIPTVRVHYNGGWASINECDFDPRVHKLYEEPAPEVEPAPAFANDPVEASPDALTPVEDEAVAPSPEVE